MMRVWLSAPLCLHIWLSSCFTCWPEIWIAPCPHCDDPDMSLLRLVLIGEILRADEMWLVLLADVLQQSGLLLPTDDSQTPPVSPAKKPHLLRPC